MSKFSSAKFEVERFDGKMNFGLWQKRVKAILVQQGLHKALLGKEGKPEGMKDADWEEMDLKALSTIQLCLADEDEERSKLDAESKPRIFLDYNEGVKGFTPWNSHAKKVKISRYVASMLKKLNQPPQEEVISVEKFVNYETGLMEEVCTRKEEQLCRDKFRQCLNLAKIC